MKIKSQKGSITIFVLVALLFYTAFLLLMYAANTNKFKTISEKSDILKGIYEKNTSDEAIDEIYKKKREQQWYNLREDEENRHKILLEVVEYCTNRIKFDTKEHTVDISSLSINEAYTLIYE